MQYFVIKAFNDLMDNRYRYEIGDEYPRKGKSVTQKRLAELSGTKNKRGIALIKKKEEPKKKEK